ncbi:MAG: GNAT family N-acetyltransferase [Acidimicrobiales bacterium]
MPSPEPLDPGPVDPGPVELGPLRPEERGALFEIFDEVVASGDGYPHRPPLTAADFDATWSGRSVTTVGARRGGTLVGAYYLRPNFVGRAAHIANAGYVVGRRWRRAGVGRAMVEDSIRRAPSLGFDAIQFNLVFASNPARALYEALGWREIGRVPQAVEDEDAVVYWRAVP